MIYLNYREEANKILKTNIINKINKENILNRMEVLTSAILKGETFTIESFNNNPIIQDTFQRVLMNEANSFIDKKSFLSNGEVAVKFAMRNLIENKLKSIAKKILNLG